jgi:hypothetical protein
MNDARRYEVASFDVNQWLLSTVTISFVSVMRVSFSFIDIYIYICTNNICNSYGWQLHHVHQVRSSSRTFGKGVWSYRQMTNHSCNWNMIPSVYTIGQVIVEWEVTGCIKSKNWSLRAHSWVQKRPVHHDDKLITKMTWERASAHSKGKLRSSDSERLRRALNTIDETVFGISRSHCYTCEYIYIYIDGDLATLREAGQMRPKNKDSHREGECKLGCMRTLHGMLYVITMITAGARERVCLDERTLPLMVCPCEMYCHWVVATTENELNVFHTEAWYDRHLFVYISLCDNDYVEGSAYSSICMFVAAWLRSFRWMCLKHTNG